MTKKQPIKKIYFYKCFSCDVQKKKSSGTTRQKTIERQCRHTAKIIAPLPSLIFISIP